MDGMGHVARHGIMPPTHSGHGVGAMEVTTYKCSLPEEPAVPACSAGDTSTWAYRSSTPPPLPVCENLRHVLPVLEAVRVQCYLLQNVRHQPYILLSAPITKARKLAAHQCTYLPLPHPFRPEQATYVPRHIHSLDTESDLDAPRRSASSNPHAARGQPPRECQKQSAGGTSKQRRQRRRPRALSDTDFSISEAPERPLLRRRSTRGRSESRSPRRSSGSPCKPMGTWKARELPKVLAATGTRPEEWFVATEDDTGASRGPRLSDATSTDNDMEDIGSATVQHSRDSLFGGDQPRPSTAPSDTYAARAQGEGAMHDWNGSSLSVLTRLESQLPALDGLMLDSQLNYAEDNTSAAVPRCLFAADDLSPLCDDVWGNEDDTQIFGAEAEYNDILATPETFVWESELWPSTDSSLTATAAAGRRASIFDLDPAAYLRECYYYTPSGDTFAEFLETVNSDERLTLHGASRTYEHEGDEFQVQAMGLVM